MLNFKTGEVTVENKFFPDIQKQDNHSNIDKIIGDQKCGQQFFGFLQQFRNNFSL